MSDDDEEYEFEYSDDDQDMMIGADASDSLEVRLENQYYIAKGLKEDWHPSRSSAPIEDAFQNVLLMETTAKTDGGRDGDSIWGFRALKQLIKWQIRRQRLEPAMVNYEALLQRISTSPTVTRNMGEKSVNGILDFISTTLSSTSTGNRLES